jgi:hypothetical protein
MTLATAIIGGLACGYFLGLSRKALVVLLPLWIAVLIVQSTLVLDDEDIDAFYVPVQIVILTIAFAMLWIGAKVRSRFGRPVPSS